MNEPPDADGVQKLANAGAAIVRNAAHLIATGRLLADPSVQAVRKLICRGDVAAGVPKCPRCRKYDVCSACGCKVGNALFTKWKLEKERCPLGKW